MPIVFKKSISFVLPYFISQQEFLFGQVLNWVFFSLFIFITHAHIIVIYFIHMSCILLFALFMNLWFHRYSQLICWKLFQWNFCRVYVRHEFSRALSKDTRFGRGKRMRRGRQERKGGRIEKEGSITYICVHHWISCLETPNDIKALHWEFAAVMPWKYSSWYLWMKITMICQLSDKPSAIDLSFTLMYCGINENPSVILHRFQDRLVAKRNLYWNYATC